MYVHDLASGKMLYRIPLPIGSVGSFYGRRNKSEMFFSFDSFLLPTVVYRADFSKMKDAEDQIVLEEMHRTKIDGLNFDKLDVKQEFYTSKDGTKVSLFFF